MKKAISRLVSPSETTSAKKFWLFFAIAMPINILAIIFLFLSERNENFIFIFFAGAVVSGIFGALAWKQSEGLIKKILAILSFIAPAILIIVLYFIYLAFLFVLGAMGFGRSEDSGTSKSKSNETEKQIVKIEYRDGNVYQDGKKIGYIKENGFNKDDVDVYTSSSTYRIGYVIAYDGSAYLGDKYVGNFGMGAGIRNKLDLSSKDKAQNIAKGVVGLFKYKIENNL